MRLNHAAVAYFLPGVREEYRPMRALPSPTGLGPERRRDLRCIRTAARSGQRRDVFFAEIPNPQPNPQILMSCATYGHFGSPRGSVKSLKSLITQRCHGRGREFESRRPRQFFQALARNWQFASWSNLVQLGQCISLVEHHANKFALCQPLVRHSRLSVKIQRNATVRMTYANRILSNPSR